MLFLDSAMLLFLDSAMQNSRNSYQPFANTKQMLFQGCTLRYEEQLLICFLQESIVIFPVFLTLILHFLLHGHKKRVGCHFIVLAEMIQPSCSGFCASQIPPSPMDGLVHTAVSSREQDSWLSPPWTPPPAAPWTSWTDWPVSGTGTSPCCPPGRPGCPGRRDGRGLPTSPTAGARCNR